MTPSNDNLANAISITAEGLTSLSGSTVDSTVEIGKETDDGYVNTVWYRIVVGADGDLTVAIKNASYKYYAEMYDATGNDPPTDFADLVQGYTTFVDGLGNGTNADDSFVTPVLAGNIYYLLVTNWDFIEGIWGAFTLNIINPIIPLCLNAADYLGSSPTASIVSGSVRETQRIDGDWGTTPVAAFEGFIGDGKDTLSIPGSAITNSPGFYAVSIKTKNSNSTAWCCGMKRNGQPLWPGAFLDSGLTTTPVSDWLTMKPNALRPNELDMLKYLPVKPEDTIEFVVEHSQFGATRTIDITEICFYRILKAIEGPAYDILDIPDFPLGMTISDLGTADQAGDLLPEKNVAPTYKTHRINGYDACVTNDGNIWVVYNARITLDAGGDRFIGPCLMKWDGASWSIINNNIEGLGFKRTTQGASGTQFGAYTISMDTDGTDLWICYGVDDGSSPISASRKVKIRVKKYDVSGASFSNVGGLINGIGSDIGGTGGSGSYTVPEAGGFGSAPTIRVSPTGVPWVGFTDYEAAISDPNVWPGYGRMPYVARWTGSSWVVERLPMPINFFDPSGNITTRQAKDFRVASGTTSEQTYLGEVCVEETQTAYTNDTCAFTPSAGKWVFKVKTAKDYVSGSANGYKFKWYKNGLPLGFSTDDGSSGNNTIDSPWGYFGGTSQWADCNGSDVISLRVAITGGGVEHVYIDELIQIDAHAAAETIGFGINAAFVDDSQSHIGLFMHRIGETILGENPGALYQMSFTNPNIDEPSGDSDYNEMGGAGYASEASFTELIGYQLWVYSEWDGDSWVFKWQKMIEEDAPDHVYTVTRTDSIASTPPYGHFQQGFGFYTDGKDNYMTANLGGGQAFGFFQDTIVALKIGTNGFVPFTEGPPGHLQGVGYPQDTILGQAGAGWWSWDTCSRSIFVGPNSNVWMAWPGWGGAPANFTDFVAHAVPNGIGGWFAAALGNEDGGYDPINAPQGIVLGSPDGTKIYICWDTDIYSDGIVPAEPSTFGVWECPIIFDAKIPLIPISGMAIRVYPDGRVEIVSKPSQLVKIEPSGNVSILSGESRHVAVEPDGSVKVLS